MAEDLKREATQAVRGLAVDRACLSAVSSFVFVLILAFAPSVFSDEPAGTPPTQTKPSPEAAPAERAQNFTLPNAQDGLTRVKWPREKAVFLTFGEQASQVPIQAWSAKMRAEYGVRMEFVGVAWLERVPAELHVAAETVIKTTHPEVLMDKTGSAAQKFKCKPAQVNAFVIAPDGTILRRIHEPMTDQSFSEVKKVLEPFTKEKN